MKMLIDVPKRTNRLATIAVIGVVFFATSATLLPLVSEYGFAGDYISELATGRFGYVQPLAFFTIALGSLSLALAFAALITFFLNGDGQWTGLYQPAFLGTILLWLVLVAIRLRSIATRSIEGREITDDRSKTAPSS